MATASIPTDRLRHMFFDLGYQYYVGGRYAVAAGLMPVAGNLLHHAIEMFLKGGLSAHTTENQRRRLNHELVDLWSAFKTHLAAGHLANFDPTVAELAKFEDIRYAEHILQNGMGAIFQFGKRVPIKIEGAAANVPKYTLFVGEIDSLVEAICEVSNVNAKVCSHRLQEPGHTYLRYLNEEANLF